MSMPYFPISSQTKFLCLKKLYRHTHIYKSPLHTHWKFVENGLKTAYFGVLNFEVHAYEESSESSQTMCNMQNSRHRFQTPNNLSTKIYLLTWFYTNILRSLRICIRHLQQLRVGCLIRNVISNPQSLTSSWLKADWNNHVDAPDNCSHPTPEQATREPQGRASLQQTAALARTLRGNHRGVLWDRHWVMFFCPSAHQGA